MSRRVWIAAATAVAAWTGAAVAQESAWTVLDQGQGAERVCWIFSRPTASEARRDNRPVQANRGDIFLTVATRPGQNVKNEVSMDPGYTYRDGGTVKVEIGGSSFTLFAQDDTAWPENAQADDQLVAAMRRGAEAKITGVSARGTTTIDTFSLRGFTAALDEARRRCG